MLRSLICKIAELAAKFQRVFSNDLGKAIGKKPRVVGLEGRKRGNADGEAIEVNGRHRLRKACRAGRINAQVPDPVRKPRSASFAKPPVGSSVRGGCPEKAHPELIYLWWRRTSWCYSLRLVAHGTGVVAGKPGTLAAARGFYHRRIVKVVIKIPISSHLIDEVHALADLVVDRTLFLTRVCERTGSLIR